MLPARLIAVATCALGVRARKLWATEPADAGNIIMTAYPLGNGKLGAMPLGLVGEDIVVLNEHSLWSGGPFQSPDYIGGNPPAPVYTALPGIRETIWETQINNDISALYGDPAYYYYGNYETLGNLTVKIAGVNKYTSYNRALDLETGIHTAEFKSNGAKFAITTFCTFLDQVCAYNIQSNKPLPDVTIGLQDSLRSNPSSNATCDANGVHLRGQTQEDIGMIFDARAQVINRPKRATCTSSHGLSVPSDGRTTSLTVVYAAGTNYDQKKGTKASNYSFKGVDPAPAVLSTIEKASKKSFSSMYNAHVKDHNALFSQFSLDLPDPEKSASVPTATLMENYDYDIGDPFVENLLFDYGRYLFIGSCRDGSLPPNLQGIWTESLTPAWSADYHVDVNVQMNHWHTEQTGLGEIQGPLWDFIIDTWVPRGTETAALLYDAPGFVGFSNLNTFGFTGQMNAAVWSNYPASAAWLMQNVWNRYDYSRDTHWWKTVGYPLMKSIAEYWIHEMVPDLYSNDGTLVAAPCNSPEHGWTTFGCTHYQQLVWEVFDHVIEGWEASGDKNTTFLETVKETQSRLSPGIIIGWFGQIQEWKIGWDQPNDEHRHLSHLVGWYPGYSIGTHMWNKTVTDAVNVSLTARGNGTTDSNTGWEKVWRVACWAQLNNTDIAYTYLKYAIDMNYANNGFSVYTTGSWPYELAAPFQIDANFGYSAAVLAMLITDLPVPSASKAIHTVILGPAIPPEWKGGSVRDMRIRGGGSVDFSWDSNGLVNKATLHNHKEAIKIVDVNGKVLIHQ
ncbi:putative alpha-fucosidase A [Trichoderma ghanense]|uniref:Alpha-fucosidase A n=1 Tax=Trichoderma ghanense TaxID=65468 RepID=A0ABY2GXH6_9HYPO